MSMTFLGPEQDHWCKIDRLQNFSHPQQKYIGIPYNEEDEEYDQCHYYNLPYDKLNDDQLYNWNWTMDNEFTNVTIEKCDEWIYDQSEFTHTALSKYDLVCDNSFLVSLVYSSFTASTIIANLLAGPLSDRFGRRTLLIIAICFEGPLGILCTYAPGYPSFLILRFLTALSLTLASTCCFILSMEVFGPQYRAIPGGLYWLFWSFGFLTLPCIAVFIRDFQKLQLVLAAPMFLTYSYFLILSESPRWLISKDKELKAEEVIILIAEVNEKDIPENMHEILNESNKNLDRMTDMSSSEGKEKVNGVSSKGESVQTNSQNENATMNVFDILKIPVLRNRILLILPGWISCTLVYYGMSFNTGTMAGNVYLNTFLSGLVEVPAYIGSLPCMYKFGRRYSQIGTLLISGSACFLCTPFLDSDNEIYEAIVTTFVLIGKAAITMAFAVIFVYTAELFPTPVRHASVAIPYMTGNIFGLAAPFMGAPMMSLWTPLPLVIFGTLGIVSGLLVILLPETRDLMLPDNIEDIKALGKSPKEKSSNIIQNNDVSNNSKSGDKNDGNTRENDEITKL